jgi:glycerol-3-phosphate acyltransferase PlsY
MDALLSPYLLAALALGYLLGSIPFGLLLTRAAGLGDIRKVGSGNIGATNVLRTGNKGLAAATLLLDALKGTLAVYIAWQLGAALMSSLPAGSLAPAARVGSWLMGAGYFTPEIADPAKAAVIVGKTRHALFGVTAGLGAFLGHIFPVWLGFKGGKGVATYIGVLLGLAPVLAALFCSVWLIVAWAKRYSSLAALVGAAVVPFAAAGLINPLIAIATGVMSALLIWKHEANIGRLRRGEEPKIGAKT